MFGSSKRHAFRPTAYGQSRRRGIPRWLVLMLTGIVLLSFSTVPLRSLMDHYAMLVGERVGKPFGRIRLWGAFGYTAFALTIGRIMNEEVTSFFLVAYGISLLLVLVFTFNLPQLPTQDRRPLLEGVGELLQNKRLLLVLLVAFAQAVCAFMIVASLGYHITSMGGNASQVGVAFAVAAVSELPDIDACQRAGVEGSRLAAPSSQQQPRVDVPVG